MDAFLSQCCRFYIRPTACPYMCLRSHAEVLRDGFIQNQTTDTFHEVWKPKYAGAYKLDMESRKLCPDLKYFVVFSSASAGHGMPGQSNYGFSNSAVEHLIEARKKAGLPGLAVQWGPIADVGLAADLDFPYGVKHQRIASCMLELEHLMLQPEVTVARSMVIAKDSESDTSSTGNGNNVSLLANVTRVLGLPDISSLSPDMTLASLGMDSLMQVEIRLCIEQYFGQSLSAEEVRSLTVQDLLNFEMGCRSGLSASKSSVNSHGICSMKEFNTQKTEDIPLDPLERQFLLLDFSVSPLVPEETLIMLSTGTCNLTMPIFFVHPIDGTCRLLKEIAQHMKRNVYGLQFSYKAPRTTFKELAAFYIQQIRTVQATGPYILLGYSVGGAISYEMAMQLEEAEESVFLIILDFLLDPKEASFSTLFTLEVGMLTQTASYFLEKLEEDTLKMKLSSLPNWHARLEHCLQLIGAHHPGDLQPALESCYWLIKAINEYRIPVGRVLRAPLLLLAATDGIIKYRTHERYNFQKITAGSFNIEYVDGNHTSFLKGYNNCEAVATIIQRWLEHQKSLLHKDVEKKC